MGLFFALFALFLRILRRVESVVCVCTHSVGDMGYMCLINVAGGQMKLHVDVGYNPFNCDCLDYQILSISRFYSFSHWLDRANCAEPPELFNKKVCFYLHVHKRSYATHDGNWRQTGAQYSMQTYQALSFSVSGQVWTVAAPGSGS